MSFRAFHRPTERRGDVAPSDPAPGANGWRRMPSLLITRGNGAGRDERVGAEARMGRAAGADIVVPEPTVSRRHARIAFEDGMYVLHDLGSRNGTFVNGQPVRAVVLDDRDVIRLGHVELVFCWAESAVG